VLSERIKRARSSALGVRMTRYTIGSLIAAATSAVVFAVLYVVGASTTACSVVAFVAGAVPNWILNRRWAWALKGRIAFGREVLAYVIVSALTLLIGGHGVDPAPGAAHPGALRDPCHAGDWVLPGRVRNPVPDQVRDLRTLDLLGPQPNPGGLAVTPPGMDGCARQPLLVTDPDLREGQND
jgi:hypothetical protein